MPVLIAALAAIVPLVITPNLFFYFDITPKVVIFLAGAVALLLLRENARNVAALLSRPLGRWFAALIGLQWILFAAATIFSTDPALSLNGGSWRRSGLITETAVLVFALLVTARFSWSKADIGIVLRAVCITGSVDALYGVAQYFGLDPILPAGTYHVGEGSYTIVRPPGTLGHADYFGAWLVMCVFCSLALVVLEERKWSQRAALAGAVLCSGAIVLTGTRAAWLGLAAGLAVLIFLLRPRVTVGRLSLLLVAVAGLAGFVLSPPGLKMRARLHWSMEDARGGARLLLWRDTLRMSASKPVFGFGPETFVTQFPRFESLQLARSYPDFYHESPHNMFLDTLQGEGLLAALVFMGLCILALYASRQTAPLAAGLAAILVCQQFTVMILPTKMYFYLLIGLVVASAMRPDESSVPATPLWVPRVLWPVRVACAIVFVVFATGLAVSDAALATAQRHLSNGDPARAAAAYKIALRWEPAGSSADLAYSRQMFAFSVKTPIFVRRMEAWQQAMDSAVRAASTAEDRQNAWYHLATLMARQNDVSGVERSLRNSIAWAPNWFKPHWSLAQLLALENRRQEALEEARFALAADGGKDPEVAAVLEKLTHKNEAAR